MRGKVILLVLGLVALASTANAFSVENWVEMDDFRLIYWRTLEISRRTIRMSTLLWRVLPGDHAGLVGQVP